MKISTRRVLKALDLRARDGGGEDGGIFRYPDQNGKMWLAFHWDGAGINQNGEIVLIEEEAIPFSQIHIQGHLSRVSVMQLMGERVDKLIWLVPSGSQLHLDCIVLPWVRFLQEMTQKRLPKIEYRNYEGCLVGRLGDAEIVSHAKSVTRRKFAVRM